MGKKELGLGRFSTTRRLSGKVKGKSDFTTEDAETAEIGMGGVLKILRRTGGYSTRRTVSSRSFLGGPEATVSSASSVGLTRSAASAESALRN